VQGVGFRVEDLVGGGKVSGLRVRPVRTASTHQRHLHVPIENREKKENEEWHVQLAYVFLDALRAEPVQARRNHLDFLHRAPAHRAPRVMAHGPELHGAAERGRQWELRDRAREACFFRFIAAGKKCR
jgi:hypothetical protein